VKKVYLYILSFLIIFIPLYADGSVHEYVLKNGLKVLIIEDDKAPIATFQIWYRVGSRDEPIGKTGISHLLEHMMFKGTQRYGPQEFSRIIQRNGGIDNAHTTKEYTMYYQTLPSDRIELSIELEADRMTNLLLNEKDVLSERAVVMEERRMRYEDDPQNILFEEVVATAFKVHPYRWPVIGWMSDIASIEREDLYAHYKTFYSPNNAFIVVIGDVKKEEIIEKIKREFEDIEPKKVPERRNIIEPPQSATKRIYLKKEAELPYLIIAYHVPGFLQSQDSFALDILSSILSGGKSSRLYKDIVYEKRIGINVFSDYSFYKDPFLFILGGTVSPEKDIKELEKAIEEQIERIKKEVPSHREVEKAKNQIESSYIFAQDSTYSRGLYTGFFEILGDWRLMEKYLDGIRAVKPEDVQEVAKRYFKDENKTVGFLIPIKNEKAN
jgi:zinc protease